MFFLSPGREENKGFYFTKRYELKGNGTFLQFLILLEKIAENERILNIKTLNLKKSDKKQRGRFQVINTSINIEAYRYNPSHREDRGIKAIDASLNDKKKKPSSKRKRKK